MCVGKVRCAMKKLIKAFILFCTVIPLFLLQTSVLAESIPETVPLSGVYDPNGYQAELTTKQHLKTFKVQRMQQ